MKKYKYRIRYKDTYDAEWQKTGLLTKPVLQDLVKALSKRHKIVELYEDDSE